MRVSLEGYKEKVLFTLLLLILLGPLFSEVQKQLKMLNMLQFFIVYFPFPSTMQNTNPDLRYNPKLLLLFLSFYLLQDSTFSVKNKKFM